MNYIVIDFEYNQAYNNRNKNNNDMCCDQDPNCPFEIIQIGAIKLDKKFNIIDNIDILIKPQIYEKVNPYVENLTGLTDKMLENKPNFKTAYKTFSKFVKSKKNILCVWGKHDMKELYRNIAYYKLKSKKIPQNFINVQDVASNFLKKEHGKSIGLKNAAMLLNIDSSLPFHDAFNDAMYTSDILIRLKKEDLPIHSFDVDN